MNRQDIHTVGPSRPLQRELLMRLIALLACAGLAACADPSAERAVVPRTPFVDFTFESANGIEDYSYVFERKGRVPQRLTAQL